MIAYKILNKDMKSFLISDYSNKYCIQYSFNKIIKTLPNTFGIFCFNTSAAILDICKYFNKKARLFKIDGRNIIEIYKINPRLDTKALDVFYRNFKNCRSGIIYSNYYSYPLNHTICFEKIKIIKEIII